MQDKKTMKFLLIFLGISVIGGAVWLYFGLKPQATSTTSTQNMQELADMDKIKNESVDNILDFLKTPKSPDSIWENLVNNRAFQDLRQVPVEISLDNISNPEPFMPVLQATSSPSE